MAGRFEFEDAGRYEFVDDAPQDRSITNTGGRAMAVGGVPAAAFKVAEAMGTPAGQVEAQRLGLGALRGIGVDIGNNLLNGGAWLVDKLTPGGAPALLDANRQREESLNQFFAERIPRGNVSAGVGRLGANVAATAGVGPALAVPLRAVGRASPTIAALANAVESAGMTTGGGLGHLADLGIRTAGGAITGGASAGLVDPRSAGTGALIGGVLPGAMQGVNGTVAAAGKAARNTLIPQDVKLARDIAEMGGIGSQDLEGLGQLRDALRQQGPTLLPGAESTVPQIMQVPGVSQLQRSVKAANPGALTAREAEQHAARMEALNRIAPVTGTVQQAAEDAGGAIANYAIPAEAAARKNVTALFDAIPPEEAKVTLPIKAMENARAKYLGQGYFGQGASAVDDAINTATEIGTRRMPAAALDYSSSDLARLRAPAGHVHASSGPTEAISVPFDEIQNLRSSVGEAITAAKRNGQARSAAALTYIKNAIDNKVADVAAGNALPGEVFTPQAVDAWGQALQAHAAKKAQFNTGPQASMFRVGSDGLPMIQGAEIPAKFFGPSRSQVENAQAFRRLVADDPRLMGDLQRYAITDAAGQVDQFGNLTNAKFNRWLAARSGATGEIFSEQQRATLKAIADDLRRAAAAENLGRSTGSDTAQKAASMMQLGLLDSPGTRYVASKVPGGRTALDFIRGKAQSARAERLGGLLAEPERLGGLLDTFIATQQPQQGLGLLSADPILYRSAPLLLTGPNR